MLLKLSHVGPHTVDGPVDLARVSFERCSELSVQIIEPVALALQALDHVGHAGQGRFDRRGLTPQYDLGGCECIGGVPGRGFRGSGDHTGHALGAAGVNEAIYALLMMENNFIAASANITQLDPAAAGMPIIQTRRDNVTLNTVLSNSFGFGGTNACLVFQR